MRKRVAKTMAALSITAIMLTGGIVSQAEGSYTVKIGDCLNKIAKEVYGDANKWKIIYESNKESIKNPDIIYNGQVLSIPDAEGTEAVVTDVVETPVTDVTAVPETASVTDMAVIPETEPVVEETPDLEKGIVLTKNIPVGVNPISYNGRHKYNFLMNHWVELPLDENGYKTEVTDSYGVTYVEYRQGANQIAINKVAQYINNNPNSNFANFIANHGNEIVIVTSWRGLWDDSSDYDWYWAVMDCEPKDCVYMFVAGNVIDYNDDVYMDSVWNDLIISVSDNAEFE